MQISPKHILNASRKRIVWLSASVLTILVLIVLGFSYRHHVLSGLDLVAEGTGSRTTAFLAIVAALIVLVCLVFWLLFPVLLYFSLRSLSRRTAELNGTLKLVSQHLAKPAADRPTVNEELRVRQVTDTKST